MLSKTSQDFGEKMIEIDLSCVTELHFPEYADFPKEINYGFCYSWAWLSYIHCMNEDIPAELIRGTGHGFIRINGKYYDSEKPKGVKMARDLPFYKRYSYKPLSIKVTPEYFEENLKDYYYWGQKCTPYSGK